MAQNWLWVRTLHTYIVTIWMLHIISVYSESKLLLTLRSDRNCKIQHPSLPQHLHAVQVWCGGGAGTTMVQLTCKIQKVDWMSTVYKSKGCLTSSSTAFSPGIAVWFNLAVGLDPGWLPSWACNWSNARSTWSTSAREEPRKRHQYALFIIISHAELTRCPSE